MPGSARGWCSGAGAASDGTRVGPCRSVPRVHPARLDWPCDRCCRPSADSLATSRGAGFGISALGARPEPMIASARISIGAPWREQRRGADRRPRRVVILEELAVHLEHRLDLAAELRMVLGDVMAGQFDHVGQRRPGAFQMPLQLLECPADLRLVAVPPGWRGSPKRSPGRRSSLPANSERRGTNLPSRAVPGARGSGASDGGAARLANGSDSSKRGNRGSSNGRMADSGSGRGLSLGKLPRPRQPPQRSPKSSASPANTAAPTQWLCRNAS